MSYFYLKHSFFKLYAVNYSLFLLKYQAIPNGYLFCIPILNDCKYQSYFSTNFKKVWKIISVILFHIFHTKIIINLTLNKTKKIDHLIFYHIKLFPFYISQNFYPPKLYFS